eukprot:g1106.t1
MPPAAAVPPTKRPDAGSPAVLPDAAIIAAARDLAAGAATLEDLQGCLAAFEGCNLKLTAKKLVFADGNPQARLMFVGEAPGRDEDLQGKPFVGRSGQLLDRMLGAIGLDRSSAYIANVVPWRPPGNRTPTPQETEICKPFILRQIELVNPDVLVFLGAASAKTLLGVEDGIRKMRGRWMAYPGKGKEIAAIATYHPAYLLRSPLEKRLSWRDFLSIKARLAGTCESLEGDVSGATMATAADKSVTALVVDLADMSCFEASLYDLSEKGCWIASDKIDLLKEEVGLRIAGFDKLIRGTVIAYGDQEAQISFVIKKEEPGEKRREIRRAVWISAVVCGQSHPITMKCQIVDASKSGCRLEGETLDRLPDAVEISIPGLDLPINGAIVWRRNGQAGVQLNWPFEPDPEPDAKTEELLKRLEEERAQEAKPKPKPKIIRLQGAIGSGGPMKTGLSLASAAIPLEKAFSVKKAPAVALIINSPGGSPVQSRLIFKRIRDLAKENEKDVLVFVEDVAASGGYMIAVAGDEIFVDPSSIVGSIGVVAAGFGFTEMIKKIGVDRRVYTAGKKKVILDPFQPEVEEDIEYLKTLQLEIHETFIDLVKSRRSDVLADDPDLFTGKFWTGRTAIQLGLVDGIGDLRSVIKDRYGDKAEPKLISAPRGLFGRKGGVGVGLGNGKLFDGLGGELMSSVEERALWARFGL